MATEMDVFSRSYKAAADLSAKQFYIVELTGTDQVNVANATTDTPIGVLQNDPKSGEAATVRHIGVSKVVSDGSGTAIVIGDNLGTGATGLAVKKTANNDKVIGIALDASTAAGAIIRVLMFGPHYLGA